MPRPLRVRRTLAQVCADDSGVAGLITATVIAIVAFTALSVVLGKQTGPGRDLRRVQTNMGREGTLLSAMLAHFYEQATPTMPCPDTDLDGDAEAACAGPGTVTGTFPWRTLGLSRNDVIDAYGNYYTYILSTAGKEVCASIGNDYDGTVDPEYTGSLITQTELEVRLSTEGAGDGRYVPFAVISHGRNGYGAISRNGSELTAPTSAAEINNASATPSAVYTGPYDPDDDAPFDDQVHAPADDILQQTCEALTPGQALNASLSDNFESGQSGIDTDKFDTTGSAATPTKTRDTNNNGVARFTAATSYFATAVAYDFNPTVRPVYVAAYWTPSASATQPGFSIVTRATTPPVSGDHFDTGLTFRFDNRSGSTIGANNLRILEDDVQVSGGVSAASYDLIAGKTYLLEVYDDGDTAWARITQRDDAANSATVNATNVVADLTGEQRVVFVNGPDQSDLDEVTVGLPMLALDTNGSGYAATAVNANGTTTGDLTLEAWIRPRSLPASGTRAAIISQWDTTDEDGSSFSLYLNGNQLMLDIDDDDGGADDQERFSLFAPGADAWTHVAVSYDKSARAVRVYRNGVLVRQTTADLDGDGIRQNAKYFGVGAEQNGVGTWHNFFDGAISDVRIWSIARSADQIRDQFRKRLSVAGSESDLVVNWKFDGESGTAGGSSPVQAVPATGENGALAGDAAYIAALAIQFRPFATDFCPSGTVVGPYQCDFRDDAQTAMMSLPAHLPAVYAKLWGAGGGAYDGTPDYAGGGGGFSTGVITNPDTLTLNVEVGAGGSGGSTGTPGENGGRSQIVGLLTADGGEGATDAAVGAGGDGSAEDGGAPNAGGDDDHFYDATAGAPSDPGRGGTTDDFDGRDGAVILLW